MKKLNFDHKQPKKKKKKKRKKNVSIFFFFFLSFRPCQSFTFDCLISRVESNQIMNQKTKTKTILWSQRTICTLQECVTI